MSNPYDVLGISKNSTTDEIKMAYKHLAFKYQAENYENNPLSDIARDKMKTLDEAYDYIMSERAGNCTGAYDDSKSQNSNSYQFPDVRRHIDEGRIDDALTILDGIPLDMRTAEWYYLKGRVQQFRGWIEEANNNYSIAIEMEPYNSEFRQAYDELNNPFINRKKHKSKIGSFLRGLFGGCSVCNLCMGLCCLDTCCGCCGDDCC